jgi:hypothetical protein
MQAPPSPSADYICKQRPLQHMLKGSNFLYELGGGE